MVGPVDESALPPELIHYIERIKARLAATFIFTLAALSVLWTFQKPQLPPEMLGIIVGALTTGLGAIVQAYWSAHRTNPQ